MQLIYISTASRSLTSEDFAQIEARSRTHNGARRISGLLLAQAGHFYGVLEGERRQVFGRMEVIISDDRHRGLRILREAEVDTRRFGNWTFGHLPGGSDSRHPDALATGFLLELSDRLDRRA